MCDLHPFLLPQYLLNAVRGWESRAVPGRRVMNGNHDLGSPCQPVRCKGEEILRHVCNAVSVLPVSECLRTTEEVQIPLNPTGCAGFQRAGKAIAACSQDKLRMMKVESQLEESSRVCNLDFFFFFCRKFGTGTKHTIKCSIEFYQVTLESFLFSLENNTGYCS